MALRVFLASAFKGARAKQHVPGAYPCLTPPLSALSQTARREYRTGAMLRAQPATATTSVVANVHSEIPFGLRLSGKTALRTDASGHVLASAVSAAARERPYPYYVAYTEEGTVRVDVRKSPQLVGQACSRGTRAYNQDRSMFTPLRIPGMVVDRKDKSSAQLMYLGVYDGHGGESCSDYLKQTLHWQIESVTMADLASVITDMREYGKDWVEYTPRALKKLEEAVHKRQVPSFLTIDERLTLAFLKADNNIKNTRWSDGQGSTACTILLWDSEGLPFWSHESQLNLIVSSVGDSKAVMCMVDDKGGLAKPLNSLHHPGVRTERERLQRHGAFFSRDSFGEERAMARVANTRAFGDWQVKRFGVIAEPEINHYEFQGDEAAFIVIVSDGVTSVLTDQEMVDVVKGCSNPEKAAKKIVDAAERLGSDDNITAQVLRLPGWEQPLTDITADHRKQRLESVDQVRRLRGSMLMGPHGGSSSMQELEGATLSSARLATPERLLKRIFVTHQRPKRPSAVSPGIKAGHTLQTANFQGLNLTVAQIQQRIRASGYRLTLVSEPEDLVLDTDEDSGSVIAVPEVMHMTLAVLGKIGDSSSTSDTGESKDFALTEAQERTTLSFQEIEKAWRLIGLHVIEA